MTKEEKLDFTLLCTKSLRGVVRVFEDGMKQPGRSANGWKTIDVPDYDLVRIKSLLRHTLDLLEGNYYDKDSGLPNIDHIAANCPIIRYHQVKNGRIVDSPVEDIKLEITEDTELIASDLNDLNIWPMGSAIPDANNKCLEKRLKLNKVLDEQDKKWYNRNKLPTKEYNDG